MSDGQTGCFSSLLSLFRRRKAGFKRPVADVAVPKLAANGGRGVTDLPGYPSAKEGCARFDRAPMSSLGSEKPPAYTIRDAEDVFRPEVIQTIEESVDKLDPELRGLSLEIWNHPEIAYQEKRAHDVLTKFMSDHGFEVTPHYLDLPTAWRANFTHKSSSFKSGDKVRVIGVNSEMDALPGIGHACGHNLIAIAGVGVALAVRAALEKHDVSGEIVLLGTPAEESGGGKVKLLERGGYDEMDACVMCHPSPGPLNTVSVGSCLACQTLQVEFFGHTAHAAWAPWEGQNALDAAFLTYSSVSVLRQQIKPTHRVHGIVSGKDWAANIIPDYSKMLWIVRAPSWSEVEALRERVLKCFEAAGIATGCRVEIKQEVGYYDLLQNSVLGVEFSHIVDARYGVKTPQGDGMGASTDFGNITYALPALHPGFTIPTEWSNHTPQFTQAAATPAAHAATLAITKGLAGAAFRVLDDAEFAAKVTQAWKRDMEARLVPA